LRDPEFIPNISELWTGPSGRAGHAYVSGFLAKLKSTRELPADDESAAAHNLERLINMLEYRFIALEILPNVEEELVAEIFVRINSQGEKLSTTDFILTLLSVFWDEGRAQLEAFSRASRRPAGKGEHSPFNHLIFPEPDQLLRVSVALGFHRARLKTMYQILRGKDLETDQFSEQLRTDQFGKLKIAQSHVLDLKHWHSFLNAVITTGYRTRELISSKNALIYAYALYLIGKLQCGVDQHSLERSIGRWFFATALTSRYSGQSETTFDADLARIRDAHSPDVFLDELDGALSRILTSDFWAIHLPDELDVATNRSPAVLAYVASQNLLNAPVLFSHKRIAEVLDPALRSTKRALEFHHLFPRSWLEENISADLKLINQAANCALLEWPDNIAIGGERPPAEYVPSLRERFSDEAWVRMTRLHALPEGWESLAYEDFLRKRRLLMAALIRRGYEKLTDVQSDDEAADATDDERTTWENIRDVELSLRRIVGTGYYSRWNQRSETQMRKCLGESAWTTIEKNRAKRPDRPPQDPFAAAMDVLQFTYIGQLLQLMVANEAWEMFKPMFRDRRELEDIIGKIAPVRNDTAHFRTVSVQQLRSCQVACEDLTRLLSVK
jgi:hypothetical protein